MQVAIQPSTLSGSITAPASKSSMQRACAAALVRRGETIIHNPGNSNDDKAALNVIKALGATVEQLYDGSLKIESDNFLQSFKASPKGRGLEGDINCGESGLGIRMFAPIIALHPFEITINGEGSLLNRPMDFFDEVLPQLGVQVFSNNGKLPLKLKGPLQPKHVTIDGSLSSQFLTGLLFAYSAADAKNVSIKVTNLKSKPYVALTLQVMEQFGLKTPVNNNFEELIFSNETSNFQRAYNEYTVEGDWSGGAFLLVAGAIAGNITVKGLDIASAQADRAVLQAFMDCGCLLQVKEDEIKMGYSHLNAFHFNATDCPDLFPPLAALAAYCEGTSKIEGIHRLAYKESNRALAIKEELGKMGVIAELKENTMLITGGNVDGAPVHSHHDHRIAMMCAVAALKAKGETVIDDAEAVSKSYPDFYNHLQRLGAVVKE